MSFWDKFLQKVENKDQSFQIFNQKIYIVFLHFLIMTKRLELNLPEDLYERLENYRKENDFLDKQDIIYEMLRKKFIEKKSFFSRIKDLLF